MIDLAHVTFSGVQPAPVSPARSASRAHFCRRPVRAVEAEHEHPLGAWILTQAGLQPDAYRPRAARRLASCLRHLKVSSPDEAERLLRRSPGLLPTALDSLLIGVTSFNRDPAVFARLQHVLIPRLLQEHEGLRVLSAGSSSGEELYSIAILLDQLGALEESDLLGLDCRLHAIEKAAAATYADEDLESLPTVVRDAYFPLTNGRRTAVPRLRARTRWHCADLLAFPGERTPRHLILFRNVAIYLRPEAAAPLWERLCGQLDQGGILVTGKGEQPPAALPLRRIGPSLYRRT